jgi:hypothetical protein
VVDGKTFSVIDHNRSSSRSSFFTTPSANPMVGKFLHNHRQSTPGELLAGDEGRGCADSCQRLARTARPKARNRSNSTNLATAAPSPIIYGVRTRRDDMQLESYVRCVSSFRTNLHICVPCPTFGQICRALRHRPSVSTETCTD